MSVMWKDPVFESLDEISKLVLPYTLSFQKEIENAFSDLSDIKGIELVIFLKKQGGRSISPNCVAQYICENIESISYWQSQLITDSQWLKITLPERIECDFVKGILLNDAVIRCKLEMTVDKKHILYMANHYRYQTSRKLKQVIDCQTQILGKAATNKRLRVIGDIIGLQKENLKTNSTQGLMRKIGIKFSDFIENLDIRSEIMFMSAWHHLIFAVEGSENSIHWLKLLKARAQKEDTMYSMEIA